MGRVKDEKLFQMIHDYIRVYLPNQRCSSRHTIRAYRMALDQLLEYTAAQKKLAISEITFDMLNSEMVSNYLDWITSEKECCASTRNHRLACIRSFFRYASTMNPENIIRQADIDKIPKQKENTFSGVDYMSEEAVQAILKQPDTKTKKGVRDQFFMILMYDSGARIQEMLDCGSVISGWVIPRQQHLWVKVEKYGVFHLCRKLSDISIIT